ncbi:MAG: energy transducer TonB [Prevotella sp.]|nr:energy transducer TonB [Prevotella sp.]
MKPLNQLFLGLSFLLMMLLSAETLTAQVRQTNRQRKPSVQVSKPQASKGRASQKVYDVVDMPPSFPGGQGALLSWIQDHIMYPIEAQKAGITGRVVLQFIVETDGSVSNVEVVRPVAPMLDQEAVRVVSSMPRWTPGKNNGTPARVRYTVPVSFK